MEWEKYSEKFTFTAEKNGYTQDTIDSLLNYAKKLYDQDLPIIFDQRHLSLLVGYKEDFLYKVSNSAHSFYRKFKIPKKSGGMRNIAEPLPSLKEIQYWILNEILYKCSVSRFAKAYVIDRSIRENARFHINQTVVLTIDIKDFFPSLSIKNVYSFFKNLGYSPAVSTMLANLCCLNKSLPQGAPTSPALSNLLMIKVDKRIAGFIKKHNAIDRLQSDTRKR